MFGVFLNKFSSLGIPVYVVDRAGKRLELDVVYFLLVVFDILDGLFFIVHKLCDLFEHLINSAEFPHHGFEQTSDKVYLLCVELPGVLGDTIEKQITNLIVLVLREGLVKQLAKGFQSSLLNRKIKAIVKNNLHNRVEENLDLVKRIHKILLIRINIFLNKHFNIRKRFSKQVVYDNWRFDTVQPMIGDQVAGILPHELVLPKYHILIEQLLYHLMSLMLLKPII